MPLRGCNTLRPLVPASALHGLPSRQTLSEFTLAAALEGLVGWPLLWTALMHKLVSCTTWIDHHVL